MGHVRTVIVERTSTEAAGVGADAIDLRLASIARDLEILTRDIALATSKAPVAAEPLCRWRDATANVAAQAEALVDALSRLDASPENLMPVCPTPASPTPLALLSLHCQQLTLIKGIDARAAQTLNELGIHRFEDIAALTPEDVKELARLLGDRRRIARECWIEQACLLAEGIETAYAARVRHGDFAMLVAPPTPDALATSRVAVPPQTPASGVVDLAGQRAERTRASAMRSPGILRRTGIAVSAIVALVLLFDAATFGGISSDHAAKTGCSHRFAASLTTCAVAQLP